MNRRVLPDAFPPACGAPYGMTIYSPALRGAWRPSDARPRDAEELAYFMDQAHDAEVARAAADAANRGKAEFIARMGHEIATPLNAIGGHVQLLTMGIHGPVTDDQRAALDRIARAQRHLIRLSNDLLNYARLESGHIEYRLEGVRLATLHADLEPMIEPQARAKRLALSFEVDPDAVVKADPDKLMQVMLNLLTNAVKFTPPGGAIRVQTAHRAGAAEPPDTVFLSVRNECDGIAPDKLAAIFEPFVQLDGTPRCEVGGAGLGLAISRELMLGMGGAIRARSHPGHATFTLALPKYSRP